MKYVVRYAHLREKPGFVVGDKIKPCEVVDGKMKLSTMIGIMGSTGASSGAHLHIDCIEDEDVSLVDYTKMWSLADIENGKVKSAHRQLNYFIDDYLFNYPIFITTYYNDPEYLSARGKVHLAYDVVPENRKQTTAFWGIWWNRTKEGEVVGIGFDPGYGYYLLVRFEA